MKVSRRISAIVSITLFLLCISHAHAISKISYLLTFEDIAASRLRIALSPENVGAYYSLSRKLSSRFVQSLGGLATVGYAARTGDIPFSALTKPETRDLGIEGGNISRFYREMGFGRSFSLVGEEEYVRVQELEASFLAAAVDILGSIISRIPEGEGEIGFIKNVPPTYLMLLVLAADMPSFIIQKGLSSGNMYNSDITYRTYASRYFNAMFLAFRAVINMTYPEKFNSGAHKNIIVSQLNDFFKRQCELARKLQHGKGDPDIYKSAMVYKRRLTSVRDSLRDALLTMSEILSDAEKVSYETMMLKMVKMLAGYQKRAGLITEDVYHEIIAAPGFWLKDQLGKYQPVLPYGYIRTTQVDNGDVTEIIRRIIRKF